mmetsp:Transcript_80069/g.222904  ORF Transcript_80069/g.222904 Transcript_80069/m.222904 type:complete len:347 (+) Transcript_80069:1067-2107(+)
MPLLLDCFLPRLLLVLQQLSLHPSDPVGGGLPHQHPRYAPVPGPEARQSLRPARFREIAQELGHYEAPLRERRNGLERLPRARLVQLVTEAEIWPVVRIAHFHVLLALLVATLYGPLHDGPIAQLCDLAGIVLEQLVRVVQTALVWQRDWEDRFRLLCGLRWAFDHVLGGRVLHHPDRKGQRACGLPSRGAKVHRERDVLKSHGRVEGLALQVFRQALGLRYTLAILKERKRERVWRALDKIQKDAENGAFRPLAEASLLDFFPPIEKLAEIGKADGFRCVRKEQRRSSGGEAHLYGFQHPKGLHDSELEEIPTAFQAEIGPRASEQMLEAIRAHAVEEPATVTYD